MYFKNLNILNLKFKNLLSYNFFSKKFKISIFLENCHNYIFRCYLITHTLQSKDRRQIHFQLQRSHVIAWISLCPLLQNSLSTKCELCRGMQAKRHIKLHNNFFICVYCDTHIELRITGITSLRVEFFVVWRTAGDSMFV